MTTFYIDSGTTDDGTDETALILLSRADITHRTQTADGGIADEAERTGMLLCRVDVAGQPMAVAQEGSTVRCRSITHLFSDGDVCHQSDVDVVLSLGRLHHLGELVPFGCGADGDILTACFCRQLLRAHIDTGGAIKLDNEVYIIVHARTGQLYHLGAGLHLLGSEHVGDGIYCETVAVDHLDAQLHLGTAVPHGTILVDVVPRDADGVGGLVLPFGGIVVIYFQQVDISQVKCRRVRIGIAFADAPQLTCSTANYKVERRHAATLQLFVGKGTDQRRILKAVEIYGIFILYDAYRLQVFPIARQRAHHNKLVARYDIFVLRIIYNPTYIYCTAIGKTFYFAFPIGRQK